jgi:hypothetical protein
LPAVGDSGKPPAKKVGVMKTRKIPVAPDATAPAKHWVFASLNISRGALLMMHSKVLEIATSCPADTTTETAWRVLADALVVTAIRPGKGSDEERTGLECPDCGTPQKRLQVTRVGDGFFVQISWHIPNAKEMRGLLKILKSFLSGI